MDIFGVHEQFLVSIVLGVALVGTIVYYWWVRHLTSVAEYRSLRATSRGGSRLPFVTMVFALALVALILLVPLVARMVRG